MTVFAALDNFAWTCLSMSELVFFRLDDKVAVDNNILIFSGSLQSNKRGVFLISHISLSLICQVHNKLVDCDTNASEF